MQGKSVLCETYRINHLLIQTVDITLECGKTKAHVKELQAVEKAVNNLAYNRIKYKISHWQKAVSAPYQTW